MILFPRCYFSARTETKFIIEQQLYSVPLLFLFLALYPGRFTYFAAQLFMYELHCVATVMINSLI